MFHTMREHFYFLVLSAMETFFSPRTVKGDQLSFLDRVPSTPKTLTVAQLWDAVSDRAYTAMTAIPPAKLRQDEIRFHREASKIGENDIVLKVSLKGRSYMIKAACRHGTIPSHYNEDSMDTTKLISPIRVYEFTNGNYVIIDRLNERDQRLFTQAAQDILLSPLSTRSMTTH